MAVFMAVQTAVSISAFAENTPQTEAIFGEFIQRRGAESFYDGLNAGEADWYAFCRVRLYGAESGSDEFAASLEEKAQSLLNTAGFVPPTEFQRTSLLLSAFGRENAALLDRAVYFNEELDRQGLNAYIWALIAAQGREPPANAVNTPDSLIEKLLSVQLDDGGFNLFGSGADADITAAAIYALAPYSDKARVKSALDAAERALTDLQCGSGAFMSLGTENCESTSQAVIAFMALGYGADDPRVSRALEAIEQYRTSDGYSHLYGGGTNSIATVQALEAFTAAQLFEQGAALFELTSAPLPADPPDTAETSPRESAENEQSVGENTQGGQLTGMQIKLMIVGVLLILAAAVLAAAFRRKKKALFAASAVLLAAGIAAAFANIRSANEYYGESIGGALTVTVSADCSSVLDRMGEICSEVNPPEVIPADGVVMAAAQIELPEGATAFDALVEAARREQIRVDYTGSAYGVYITGIGFIYEFGFGSQSGWLYRVNGEFPQVSAGEYELSAGDLVEFVYTCELGSDIS